MEAEVGQPVTSTLVDPGALLQGNRLGARIEVPVTRAILSYWREAVFDDVDHWEVLLDGIPLDVGPGDYNIVWRTDDPEPPAYEAFIPLHVVPVGALGVSGGSGATAFPPLLENLVAITPSADDVAALERTRTKDEDGNDEGTFNANTTPTDADVDKLILQAVYNLLGELPVGIDPIHYESVKRAITLHAAVLVEGSFFRDDVNREAVNLYLGLAKDALAGVEAQTMVEDVGGSVRLA